MGKHEKENCRPGPLQLNETSSDCGDAEAQYKRAVSFEEKHDHRTALKWYRKAARQGHTVAQNNLGVFYNTGVACDADTDKAIKWFKRAAEQGNAAAQLNLGLCYSAAQDYVAAADWYAMAAEGGDADALNRLGLCYDNGEGVKQNDGAALHCYRKAAARGFADAQLNLKAWYEDHAAQVEQQHMEAELRTSHLEHKATVVPLVAHRAVSALRLSAERAKQLCTKDTATAVVIALKPHSPPACSWKGGAGPKGSIGTLHRTTGFACPP